MLILPSHKNFTGLSETCQILDWNLEGLWEGLLMVLEGKRHEFWMWNDLKIVLPSVEYLIQKLVQRHLLTYFLKQRHLLIFNHLSKDILLRKVQMKVCWKTLTSSLPFKKIKLIQSILSPNNTKPSTVYLLFTQDFPAMPHFLKYHKKIVHLRSEMQCIQNIN